MHATCRAYWRCRGGSRVSGKGVRIYKGVGVRFADFISFFLNIICTTPVGHIRDEGADPGFLERGFIYIKV